MHGRTAGLTNVFNNSPHFFVVGFGARRRAKVKKEDQVFWCFGRETASPHALFVMKAQGLFYDDQGRGKQ